MARNRVIVFVLGSIALIELGIAGILFLKPIFGDNQQPVNPGYNKSLTSYPYFLDKTSFFEENGILEPSVVMLGDSITDRGEWSELFPGISIVNRGIGRDTSYGVLQRISQVIQSRPQKVFLMIGINDINRGFKPQDILENYEQIVTKLLQADIQVYIESVLYTHSRNDRANEVIAELNRSLSELARTSNKVEFIDLNRVLASNARLSRKYSRDGLHLNGSGYKAWAQEISPYLIH